MRLPLLRRERFSGLDRIHFRMKHALLFENLLEMFLVCLSHRVRGSSRMWIALAGWRTSFAAGG